MINQRLATPFFNKYIKTFLCYSQVRNIQLSIIGAASEIGSNLALLVKQNCRVDKLQLYDDDEKVKGLCQELNEIPGGPFVSAFVYDLPAAVKSSEMVLMVARAPRKPGITRNQMLSTNAYLVQRVCKALADQNPNAFLAISTNPINSIVPLASSLMYQYSCYNPFKILGVTHIDTARTCAITGNALQTDPKNILIPVIGGHSEETILPLFSNLCPTDHPIDAHQADTLTRLIRRAGTDVMNIKQGTDSATVAMAWSINEFVNKMVEALYGCQVVVNSYTANPHFGSRFFSGPTVVGPYGIIQTCFGYSMNEYEKILLARAVPVINRDVTRGEEQVRIMMMAGKGR